MIVTDKLSTKVLNMTVETTNILRKRVRYVFTIDERKVLVASSVGTIFEWYDFYLYATLAPIIAKQFFAGADSNSAFIFALLVFAAGYIFRPLGAVIFGNLGDSSGRKYTFLLTILIMGLATFIIGLIPNYQMIGIAAPIILVFMRIIQGFALGGEYGGAAIYVAEHAPNDRRATFTGWIQVAGISGLLLSVFVTLIIRNILGEQLFADWGWRIPFLFSLILLLISIWIRLSLNESPAFIKMKQEGKHSKTPLAEAFSKWKNIKTMLLAIFGLISGSGVVSIIFLAYALLFLTQTLHLDYTIANGLFAMAAVVTIFAYLFIAYLADIIGRKPIMLTGFLLASLTLFPIYKALTHFANPALELAQKNAPVYVNADPKSCHFQFNPTGTAGFISSCDIAKARLISAGINYINVATPAGSIATIRIGDKIVSSYEAGRLSQSEIAIKDREFSAEVMMNIKAAGYPTTADPAFINKPMILLLLSILGAYVAMVYAPLAAILVELFPTRIRYTALSVPYHLGTACFGGLLPTVIFSINTYSGNIYDGLWYPVIIAIISFVVYGIFIKETKGVDINEIN